MFATHNGNQIASATKNKHHSSTLCNLPCSSVNVIYKEQLQDLKYQSELKHELLGRPLEKKSSKVVQKSKDSRSRNTPKVKKSNILTAEKLMGRYLCEYDKSDSRKKVRFAAILEDSSSSHGNDMAMFKHRIWYQNDDYKRFKDELANEVVLEKLQQKNRKGVLSSYSKSLENIYKYSFNKNIDITLSKQIVECATKKSPSRRGVETYLMLNAKIAAKEYRQFIVKKYFDILKDEKLNTTMKGEALRWFSKPRTQPSRSFAQTLGDIDASILND